MKVLVLVLVFCLIVICASQEFPEIQPRSSLNNAWDKVCNWADDTKLVASNCWARLHAWLDKLNNSHNSTVDVKQLWRDISIKFMELARQLE